MDLGRFNRSTASRLTWLAGPPLLIVAMCVGSLLYEGHTITVLAETRTLLNLLPEMERIADLARQTVAQVAPRADAAESIERIRESVADLSQRHQVVLNAFGMVPGDEQPAGNATRMRMTLHAEGSMKDLACFMGDLQAREPLLVVDGVRLTSLRVAVSEPLYKMEEELSYYLVNP